MAPAPVQGSLVTRQSYNCDYYGCYNSNWDNWGRWVALAVIVIVVLLIAFLFSCFNSRRRRRRGLQPMYGTGWMVKPPVGNPPGYNNQGYYGGHAPPPPYMGNQATGTTFNPNDGYYGHGAYGGQQGGIELQQPSSSYQPQRGGDPVYEAPMGPPPAKGDGIIR